MPTPSAFSLNAQFAPALTAGTSCACVTTTLPFASRNSHASLSGALGFDPPLVTRPSTVAALSLVLDRKSTRLNSSHGYISYAVFCLKKKKKDSEGVFYCSEPR